MKKRPLQIYFAGDLFDSKDLGGNVLLASAIEEVSGGAFQVMLPQDGECEVQERTSCSIRDSDFELLFGCDVIVANFDGTDLDSGTVVEFCFAKMLDLPAVLLRTDFRSAGDHTLPDGSPWNLMCSHYPRTVQLPLNGMRCYHECKSVGGTRQEFLERYYRSLAEPVVCALNQVISQPGWLSAERVMEQYRTTIQSIGGSLAERLPEEKIQELAESKISAGIYKREGLGK